MSRLIFEAARLPLGSLELRPMSVTGSLLAFGVRYVFDVSADHLVERFEGWLTDHSEALPKALTRANDRAWAAVGLALVGDSFLGAVKDLCRDGDMKGVRDQVTKFLDQTDAGLGLAKAEVRAKAAEELVRLRKAKRLSAGSIPLSELARRAATMERHGDPARMVAHAHQAVTDAAAALRPEAPHLAAVLTAAPEGGTPLLAAAFAFFFRRELETDTELAHGLSFDFLRRISTQQESGLALLEGRTAGILDQIDVLFDTLEARFDALESRVDTRFDTTDEKIDDVRMGVRDLREQINGFIGKRYVATGVADPLKVSVTTEKELTQLRHYRDEMRKLPPGLLEAADWSKLGDALAAGGLFGDAWQAQQVAAEAARLAADRAAEAEAEYKAYRAACEAQTWDSALGALVRAAEMDPARFAPFPLARYEPMRILGVGGFGTVFHCRDRYTRDREVAIKSLHTADLVRDLETVFAEAQILNDLAHPGIVKVFHWEFAGPARSRPYLVLEHFAGEDLAAYLKRRGPLPIDAFVVVARQVAEAMRTAHAAGVLHRDLKPGNILIRAVAAGEGSGAGYEVRVIDFGLAVRAAAAQASVSTSLPRRTRRELSFAGTLEYASPEQKGVVDTPVGPRSDVYSFGRTMLEALLGTLEPVTEDWEVVPNAFRKPLKRILERCIVRDVTRRYPDFEPVILDLAKLLGVRSPGAAAQPPAVETPVVKSKPTAGGTAPVPTIRTVTHTPPATRTGGGVDRATVPSGYSRAKRGLSKPVLACLSLLVGAVGVGIWQLTSHSRSETTPTTVPPAPTPTAPTRRTVPELITALQHRDAEVRERAAEELGSFGPEAQPAVPALIAALNDRNGAIASFAGYSLAEVGPGAAPQLIAAWEAGTISPGQLPPIPDWLERRGSDRSLYENKPSGQLSAARALLRLAPVAPDAMRALLAPFKQPSPNLRDAVLVALQYHHPSATQAVPALVEALRDETTRKRALVALWQFGPIAKGAAPEIAALLQDSDPHVRRLAAYALCSVAPLPRAALDQLATDLGDMTPYQVGSETAWARRTNAASALAEAGSAARGSVPTLVAAIKTPRVGTSNDGLIESATKALIKIGDVPDEAIEALIGLLQHPHSLARRGAIEAFRALGPRGAAVVPHLVKVMNDQARQNRYDFDAEIPALAAIGPAAKEATPILETMRRYRNRLAPEATFALCRIEGVTDNLLDGLSGFATDHDHMYTATRLLMELGPDARRATPTLMSLLNSAQPSTRSRAADALGAIGEAGEGVVPGLTNALKDAEPTVRQSACRSLGRIGPSANQSLPALAEVTRDQKYMVREAARKALESIQSRK